MYKRDIRLTKDFRNAVDKAVKTMFSKRKPGTKKSRKPKAPKNSKNISELKVAQNMTVPSDSSSPESEGDMDEPMKHKDSSHAPAEQLENQPQIIARLDREKTLFVKRKSAKRKPVKKSSRPMRGSNFSKIPIHFEISQTANQAALVTSETQESTQRIRNYTSL